MPFNLEAKLRLRVQWLFKPSSKDPRDEKLPVGLVLASNLTHRAGCSSCNQQSQGDERQRKPTEDSIGGNSEFRRVCPFIPLTYLSFFLILLFGWSSGSSSDDLAASAFNRLVISIGPVQEAMKFAQMHWRKAEVQCTLDYFFFSLIELHASPQPHLNGKLQCHE
ncbi:hypothetical protein I7I53_10192 [Histoplasma capsulatum var. duboisii H88]|uniref:Uncharacterized protein n=1 Tax=Ajellomyces capsulatus (strain H88) TaxID=544711 RepID=A0A8A1LCK1_AJEC8|nr:hypothetical protein I7I53_10192 [Histoplasma capsulatum var. duboisii H88]